MKRSFKFIIIVLILLFINVNNVDAKVFKLYDKGAKGVGSISLHHYYIKDDKGNEVTLYCRDAGLFAPTVNEDGHENGEEMSVTPLDPSNKHDAGLIEIMELGKEKGYSYEVINMAIRFYEYMFGRVNVDTRQPDDYKVARNIIDNIIIADNYVSKWLYSDSTFKSNASAAGAQSPSFNYYFITNYGFIGYNTQASQDAVKYAELVNVNPNQIKELLTAGIAEAANVLSGDSTTRTETSITMPYDPETKDKSDEENYIKEVEYTFSTKGFDIDKDSILMTFTCEDCETYNVDYKININGEDVTDQDLEDIKSGKLELIGDKYIKEKKDILTVILTFSVAKEDFDCANEPDYTIEFKYTGDHKEVAYAQYDFPGRTWSDQVFVGDHWEIVTEHEDGGSFSGGGTSGGSSGESDDDKDYTGSFTETDKVKLCEGDCEELKNTCETEKNNGTPEEDIPACKEYKERNCPATDCDELKKTCDEELKNNPDKTEDDIEACKKLEEQNCPTEPHCNVYVSETDCAKSATNNELIIREGTDGSNACDSSAKVDVYGCVTQKGAADNNDNKYVQTKMPANNEYSKAFTNGNINFSNKFCQVACVENYKIKLPLEQSENAGRYLRISATVTSGNKTCYTSEINKGNYSNPLGSSKDSFEYLFEVEREKMIEYNNIENFYTALGNAIKENEPTEENHTSYNQCKDGGLDCDIQEEVPMYKYEFSYNTYSYAPSDRSNPAGQKEKGNIRLNNGYFDIANSGSKFKLEASKSDPKLGYYANHIHISCTNSKSDNSTTCTITTYGFGAGNYITLADLFDKSKYEDISAIFNNQNSDSNKTWINDIYPSSSYNYTDYENNITNANASAANCRTTMTNLSKELAECSGWDLTNNYKYNPEFKFAYEEIYLSDKNNNGLKDTLITNTPEINVNYGTQQFCDNKFTFDQDGINGTCSGNKIQAADLYEDRSVKYYDASGKDFTEKYKVAKPTAVYQNANVSNVEYSTPTQFRTLLPSGVVITPNDESIENSIEIPEGWPLEFNGQGVYTYRLFVNNLGEYYDQDDKLGRVWSSGTNHEKSLVTTAITEDTCAGSGDTDKRPNLSDVTGEYFCSYKVNCKYCPSSCDPSKGICEEDCIGVCKSSCDEGKGICLFDGQLNVSTVPTTPNNLNPNDRELGVNWQWDDTIDTWLELKAYVSTQEIEEDAENIFDINFGGGSYTSTTTLNNNYAIQFDLNGEVINWIKTYNNGKNYADDTLECYDYTNPNNTSETYKGMFCYSTFIDKLITEFNDNRGMEVVKIKEGTRLRPDERVSSQDQAGWWETWDKSVDVYNKWTTTTSISINNSIVSSYPLNSYSGTNVGPAWK